MTNQTKRQTLLLLGVFLLGLGGGFLVWKLALSKERRMEELPAAVNSLGMEFRHVPAGTFVMGSPENEEGRDPDEEEHEVEITRPYYLGVREVTQGQFEKVMGFNPTFDRGDDGDGRNYPVENVTWTDAVEFCKRLSELPEEKSAGRTYRLPTEAEWEHACRAGESGRPFALGDYLTKHEATFDEDEQKQPRLRKGRPIHPQVPPLSRGGRHRPNRWHLEDMHGNVWEWCADWYDEDYYRQAPKKGPRGPGNGTRRVVRGGSRATEMVACRSANRAGFLPGWLGIGFRVVMVEGEGR